MANAEAETVDFEPEDDDLMDEDVDTPSSPRAPIPRIKSLVTGGSSSAPRKTKGRGFREDAAEADRNARMSARFDSLDSDGGPGPERCQFPLSLSLTLYLYMHVCVNASHFSNRTPMELHYRVPRISVIA